MKSILLTLAACALVAAAGDAPFAGDWMGSLDINGKTIRIALHLKHGDGRWSGTFDSPDQGASGIPMDQVDVDGNKLVWKMAAAGIVYEGAFDPATGTISGTLLQGGAKLALRFKHTEPPAPMLRHRCSGRKSPSRRSPMFPRMSVIRTHKPRACAWRGH